MNNSFKVFGLSTGIITTGDSISDRVIAAADQACRGFKDGDILVLAETAVATAEGNVITLSGIVPSAQAKVMGEKYQMDPRTVEVVIRESDSIVGGIKGFLLCMKGGTLLPNARRGCIECPPRLCYTTAKKPGSECSNDKKQHRGKDGSKGGSYYC